jgi:hypothetical protein
MRRFTASLLALLCLAALAPSAFADAGLVALKASKSLMKDVDALPRLASGAKPAILLKINATLAQIDAQALREARECLRDKGNDYARTVSTTMRGPGFVSLDATAETSCGGAYPSANTQALVFDLATGKLADWATLLPGKIQFRKYDADLAKQFAFDPIVSSDALWALYKKAAKAERGDDADCADALDEKLDFRLTLDAKLGAVVVDEVGLRHQIQACGTTIYLWPDDLKSLGASKDLIDALEIAHRQVAPAGER